MNELVQAVLCGVQGQRLVNVTTNPPRSDNSWHILKKCLKEEEIVRYSNGWNPLSSKTRIKKRKYWYNKKRETSKEEAPVASTGKSQASQPPQGGKKINENSCRKTYSPIFRI
ncbi:hypothetical protein O181_064678 [Austropuccinia psidii MF-1]|uniref:Uncharacterized protein n=1 Tax=Austropuccinia psidii MF-1 TaxID=1389203 RepID=A0A9Q3I1V2_9BASI|nr:hypothetical protein [Austropuccinia psidii MF-1]